MKSRLTLKGFVISNAITAALFLNVLLFGPLLRAGTSFTAGLATGIGAGWLILIVAGIVELRRPGRTMDERQRSNYTKASAFAFWIVLLTASVLQIMARSESLALGLSATGTAAIIGNLGLAAFGLSWAVIAKRS
jgi:hypothetical protein